MNSLVHLCMHLLFFMSRREDLQNLDSEIEAFLGESWYEEQDPETGKWTSPRSLFQCTVFFDLKLSILRVRRQLGVCCSYRADCHDYCDIFSSTAHPVERQDWEHFVCEWAGKTYYTNIITNEVLDERPTSASSMNPTPVSHNWSDSGTAVMPRARTLRKMGRFDLHNAVSPFSAWTLITCIQQRNRLTTEVFQIEKSTTKSLDSAWKSQDPSNLTLLGWLHVLL